MIKEQLKRLFKGSLIYGVGTILNRFLSFLLLPLFTQYLQPGDYGIMAMLAVLNMVLLGVFTLGTGNSMGICYFETEDKNDRGQIVWTTFVLLLLSAGILLLAGSFFAAPLSKILLKTEAYSYLVLISLAGLGVNMVTMPLYSFLRMEEKAKTFVSLTTVYTVLSLGLSVYAVAYLQRGVKGFLEAGLVSGIIVLIITLIMVLPALKISLNLKWIPKLVRIGYPSIFGVGAFFVIDWVDRLMIQRMVGMEELGIYSIGYTFGMVMIIFAEGAFGSAWPPYFLSFSNKREEAIILFGKIFKYSLFFYGTLVLLFFMLARPLVSLLTTAPFHSAYTVVGLIAAAYMIKVLYLLVLPGFYYHQKFYLQAAIEWGAAIINIGLNFLLVPRFQKEGAAMATLLAYLSLLLLAYLIGQKLMRVKYDWPTMGKFAALLVITAVILSGHFTGSILINSSINGSFFIAYCFIVYFCILTQNERGFIMEKVRAICRRTS
ncbi:MAG: oligosaccharide flippase family protein [bacterium]|nr:oligosaccharide flippase family protein [bacterium]